MGIRTRGIELQRMDELVSKLILKGQPLTHIHSAYGEKLDVSQRTLYNYIDAGVFSIGNVDLRRRVGYRPRKKKRDRPESFLDYDFRKNRSYDDFLKYLDANPETSFIEMDTMKGAREQGKRLLTMIFHDTSVMLLFLLRDGKADTVVEVFDHLTSLLGIDTFRKLFPVILTDNGSEFKHSREIERTVDGLQRTHMFFCDPYSSWQKPHIEKNHEFVRYVLKKGKSLNPFIQQDMTLLANHINSIKRAGLDGCCPYELVVNPEMIKLMSLLGLEQVPPDEVYLKPTLFNPR
jgi:IS30 family transposase